MSKAINENMIPEAWARWIAEELRTAYAINGQRWPPISDAVWRVLKYGAAKACAPKKPDPRLRWSVSVKYSMT